MARVRGGQPGNLNRIKGQPRFFTEALMRRLLVTMKDPRGCVTKAEAREARRTVDILVNVLVEQALDGEMTALRMIADRIEGTPIQTMAFVPLTEQEDTVRMTLVRDKVKEKTFDELAALYRETLSEATPTHGSA